MSVDVKIIESLDFFKGMTYEELEQFANLLESRNVEKGEILLKQGTPALTFFVIQSAEGKLGDVTGVDGRTSLNGTRTVIWRSRSVYLVVNPVSGHGSRGHLVPGQFHLGALGPVRPRRAGNKDDNGRQA